MNRINTVGRLRAVLAGLPDDATIRPAIQSYVTPAPGLYVIRYAPGTCNAAFAEVVIEPAARGVAGTFADKRGTFADKAGTFADPARLQAWEEAGRRIQAEDDGIAGVALGDPADKLRRCSLGCFDYGQCQANMHGVPSECAAGVAPPCHKYGADPGCKCGAVCARDAARGVEEPFTPSDAQILGLLDGSGIRPTWACAQQWPILVAWVRRCMAAWPRGVPGTFNDQSKGGA